MAWILATGVLYLGVISVVVNGQNCSEDKIRKCMILAEPMLKDPHLIFPDNMNDIEIVCRTWSNFVDCIQRYIDKCFSKTRKAQFHSAVEPPIASVHQMCSVSSYQAEYLQYASCIKATVIAPEHCGAHYSVLVNEVSQETVRKPNLCCAYHNFRTCVILKTRLKCDGNQAEGIAARFSRQVLDKAFRFLQDQCVTYVSDTGKCPSVMVNSSGALPNSRYGEGRSVVLNTSLDRANVRKTAFSDVYRNKATDHYNTATSTAQPNSYENHAVRQQNFTNPSYDQRAAIVVQQTPITSPQYRPPAKIGKIIEEQKHQEETLKKAEPVYFTPAMENSVATQRPSSYGRGISWTTQSTTTSKVPDWATSTWLTDKTTEEIWYPAAGSFGGNNIDEPNQQGLSRNAQTIATVPLNLCFILLIAFSSLYLPT